ncbi:MAG TPA: DMT family transporter [bacterium]|jgi:drug/metabolite transporter (DMT)-like permease
MKLKEWGAFWLLGVIWGSSFLWIKIAVADIGPITLVAFRLLFALLGLVVVLALQQRRFPRDARTLWALVFMGVFNTAIPFALISWGETRIDSALASILNGTVPLFTIVIAHYWLADEKISAMRVIGLIIGFLGVVVLVSRDFGPQGLHSSILGQVAVLAAAISYGMSATFSRRHLRGVPPAIQATSIVFVADALAWASVPIAEHPVIFPRLPITWFALAWLGLLGSCIAYLLYFYLLNAVGATKSTLVTYVFPVIGLLLGIIFLGEAADWRLLVGSALIVGGIAVVNLRTRPRRQVVATV